MATCSDSTLTSKAEKNALKCLKYSFCKSLKLEKIKDTLSAMLSHIGDNGMFAEYTMHDITHVDAMLALLEKIIPDDTKKIMTSADWLMIVLAVYFHDLGMHIPAGEYDNRDNNNEYKNLKSQLLKDDEIKKYVESLGSDKGEKFLYQEYVRKNHGNRIHEWIVNSGKRNNEPYKMIDEMLAGLDSNFRSDLALICQSHLMDELPEHLKSVDEAYGSSAQEKVNLLYVSVLLRSADILHMTHDRTPEVEFRIISPQNKISVIEWAKQHAVRSVDIHYEKDEEGKVDRSIQPHAFEVQARFSDDKCYFSFLCSLNYAIEELKRCHTWCEESRQVNSNAYYYPWTDIDSSRVLTEGFSKNKLKFEIDQNNILKLLTGHTLYNDTTVVLRELIQNAMDAGKLQDSLVKSGSGYNCQIDIHWDSNNRILRVADNATGMDTDTITNYLLKVGVSKYQSEAFKKDYPDFHSISRFGIGLLTCFMISDDVDVYTLDEQENQCHLLKIRNLNGEYLMRNDADRSHILGGKHGTTFELKVRPEISMDDLERDIRQWVIIPFGEIRLTIDSGDPVNIGYKSAKEAVETYAKMLYSVDYSNGRYRVMQQSKNGVEVAFLQNYNPTSKLWSIYSHIESDYILDAPIGICVEGIKVTTDTPGMRGRDFLALVNCSGKKAPTTNVARNDLEGGELLDQMYETVYEAYIDSYLSQITHLCDDYSLTWATTEVNFFLDEMCASRPFARIDKRELLEKVIKNAECIPIDSGHDISLCSLNTLPDKISTIDSRAFTSAVSLLKDVKATDKTAFGLLSELEKRDITGENILLTNSIARYIYDLYLNEYEIEGIVVEESARKINFTWSKNTGKWKYLRVSGSRFDGCIFVLMNREDLKIEGMGEKVAIRSNRCVYLVNDSPLLEFLKVAISEAQADEEELEVMANMVFRVIMNNGEMDEQSLDSLIRSDYKYFRMGLIEKYSVEQFKAALKGCCDSLVDIDKYYRYPHWEDGDI